MTASAPVPMSKPLLHVAHADDLARARESGRYRCASLESEGFVHCCDAAQLAGVVSRFYRDVDDLVLLEIDPEALDVELVRENTMGGVELFPHVYGPIPLAAVHETHAFGLRDPARLALADAEADAVGPDPDIGTGTGPTGDDDR